MLSPIQDNQARQFAQLLQQALMYDPFAGGALAPMLSQNKPDGENKTEPEVPAKDDDKATSGGEPKAKAPGTRGVRSAKRTAKRKDSATAPEDKTTPAKAEQAQAEQGEESKASPHYSDPNASIDPFWASMGVVKPQAAIAARAKPKLGAQANGQASPAKDSFKEQS